MTEPATLPKSVKDRILSDYSAAQEMIADVVNNPDTNGLVGDPDYLSPTVKTGSVPLRNPAGKFQYFLRIQNALEAALKTGRIPKELLPKRAPDYICELVSKE